MAYQPNPFVDPNQRGVELPAGCKDLHDMLARVGGVQLRGPSRVQAGRISATRYYLAPLYQAKSEGVALVIMSLERGALLTVSCRDGRFELTLPLRGGSVFLREAIVEIFGEAALAANARADDEMRAIHIQLPDFWDDAAQRLIDLLIRGYGLPA